MTARVLYLIFVSLTCWMALNFDIARRQRGTVFVAEAKSITNENEEEQLRLGLG